MNGSVIVGGWAVVMLVAAAACGEDSAPLQVSAPASPDTSSNGTSGAPNPVEETPAPSADESGVVPSPPASTEGETPAPPLDLTPAMPVMGAAPAEPVDNTPAEPAAPDPWKVLFNGQNLDGWTVSRGAEAGQTIAEIFQVTDGMLHVYKGAVQGSSQPTATIRTNDSYSNYVFQFEYMWATNRFGGRSNTDRDAGLLFHVFNNLNAVWPDSLEFQMGSSPLGGEWVSGDIFMIGSLPRAQTTSIRTGNNFVFAEPEMGGMRRPIGAPNGYER
ncbi:MAG: family 16 glycoside hydrolase, partial [Deltaproteobacteria bacterium]